MLVTLTERGRELLESHRTPEHEPRQAFYSGDARARELAHDAQLLAAYVRTADRRGSRPFDPDVAGELLE